MKRGHVDEEGVNDEVVKEAGANEEKDEPRDKRFDDFTTGDRLWALVAV
jgi:hypothetical protein